MPNKNQLVVGAIGLILPFIIAASVPQAHCEYQILSNTNECLGHCETIFRMKCDRALTPKGIFQFNPQISLARGANNFTAKGVDILRDRFYHINVSVYGNCTGNRTSNITGFPEPYNYTCVVNTTEEKIEYEQWERVDPDRDIYTPNQWHFFKVWADRPAKLGSNNAEVSFYVGDVLVFDPPWLSGWDYRKNITANTTAGYPLRVSINMSELYDAGKMDVDCNDTRFTNETGTELDFWIQNCTATNPSENTTVFVEADSTLSDGIIQFYYGNASASASTSGTNTFDWYDDFEDADITDWAITGNVAASNSRAFEGNYSIFANDTTSDTPLAYYNWTTTRTVGIVQFAVYPIECDTSCYNGRLSCDDATIAFDMHIKSTHAVTYWNGASHITIAYVPFNEWSLFEYRYNITNNSMEVYINGSYISQATTSSDVSAKLMQRVMMGVGGGSARGDKAYWDVVFSDDWNDNDAYSVGIEETEVVDTCTPPASGNWNVLCNDTCSKSSANINVVGDINLYGTGGNLTFVGINVTANNLNMTATDCDLILIPPAELITQ